MAIALVIGVHPREKKARQRLLMTVECVFETEAIGGDEITNTFDYDRIHDIIKSLEERESINTQEYAIELVAEKLAAFPQIVSARILSRKPDIFEDCEYVGVEYEFDFTR